MLRPGFSNCSPRHSSDHPGSQQSTDTIIKLPSSPTTASQLLTTGTQQLVSSTSPPGTKSHRRLPTQAPSPLRDPVQNSQPSPGTTQPAPRNCSATLANSCTTTATSRPTSQLFSHCLRIHAHFHKLLRPPRKTQSHLSPHLANVQPPSSSPQKYQGTPAATPQAT